MALDPAGGDVLWALENDSQIGSGRVVRSTDGERFWHNVLRPQGSGRNDPISSLAVTSPHDGWVTTCGTGMRPAMVLRRSTDGGATWMPVRPPVPEGGTPSP